MQPHDYQKLIADLKRFDAEVSQRQVGAVACAALKFVQEHLRQPYASLVLNDPDQQRLLLLTTKHQTELCFQFLSHLMC